MKKLGIIIVLALLYVSTGCGERDTVGESQPDISSYIEITLRNHSDEDTHMWISGGQISPDNKVRPGGERTANYRKSDDLMSGKIENETVSIFIGRNGLGIAQKNVTVYDEWEELEFGWNGTGWTDI